MSKLTTTTRSTDMKREHMSYDVTRYNMHTDLPGAPVVTVTCTGRNAIMVGFGGQYDSAPPLTVRGVEYRGNFHFDASGAPLHPAHTFKAYRLDKFHVEASAAATKVLLAAMAKQAKRYAEEFPECMLKGALIELNNEIRSAEEAASKAHEAWSKAQAHLSYLRELEAKLSK